MPMLMESVFFMSEGDRAAFIFNIINSLGCTYICLWSYSYSPPHNYLSLKYGYYHHDQILPSRNDDQPSSSTGLSASSNMARMLFDEYKRKSILVVDNHHLVPGLAFTRRSPYLELREPELQRMASCQSQSHFYEEARIKVAVFMGCNCGEIELGMSSSFMPQANRNLELEMRNLFPEDFSILSQLQQQSSSLLRLVEGEEQQQQIPKAQLIIGSAPSSSSTSMGSPEYSPSLVFTIPTADPSLRPFSSSSFQLLHQEVPTILHDDHDHQPAVPSSSTSSPFDQILHQSLPTPESTDVAMTRTMLAILSSSSSHPPISSSAQAANIISFHPPYNSTTGSIFQSHLLLGGGASDPQKPSAFKKWYTTSSARGDAAAGLGLRSTSKSSQAAAAAGGVVSSSSTSRRQNILKRVFGYLRSLNYLRLQQQQRPAAAGALLDVVIHEGQQQQQEASYRLPSNTQLHHMISERRRREKINESFQALKAMLPPGTKKDKASLLRTTKDYLNSLKAHIAQLTRRNQILEAQLIMPAAGTGRGNSCSTISTSEQRRVLVSIHITPAVLSSSSSSSSPISYDRIFDLHVALTGDSSISTSDLITRVLEFLKQIKEISLISMDAEATLIPSNSDQTSTLRLNMRLRLEKNYEWDEAAFQEAVKRVVVDLAHQ